MDFDFVVPVQPKNGAYIIPTTLHDLHLYRHLSHVFVLLTNPQDSPANTRVGSDSAGVKLRDHLRNLDHYDLSDSLQEGELCILDLGVGQQVFEWVAELFHQLPQARVIFVGSERGSINQLREGFIAGLNWNEPVSTINIDSTIAPAKVDVSFGVSGTRISREVYEQALKDGQKVLFLEKDIRRSPKDVADQFTLIAAGHQTTLLTIHCEAINSAYLPGQCEPLVIGGLTGYEILRIVEVAAKQSRILHICGFNPAVEAYMSGQLLARLVYAYVGAFRQIKH